MEIDFLSACYGCTLFLPQKFLSFALLKHNSEVSSAVGVPDRPIVCKANHQLNHTASGIVSNKKVMKAARDYQLDFCSSFWL